MNAADAFRRYHFPLDAIQPLDITTYLTTVPKKYEPTEAAIADRAKEVQAYWAQDVSRHYGKFYTALEKVCSNDTSADELFDLWLAGDTAEMGNALAKAVNNELAEMADQYARDEFAGVLGSRNERIPL